jgi:hypothetical protein
MEEDAPSNFNSNNKTLADEQGEIAAVLDLGPFERFVYVMSVLEHYSDQDCSVLLGCRPRGTRSSERNDGSNNVSPATTQPGSSLFLAKRFCQ